MCSRTAPARDGGRREPRGARARAAQVHAARASASSATSSRAMPSPATRVVFLQTIEHVQNPGEILDHFRSMLRPGGVAFVSTPNVLTLAPEGAEKSGNPWHVKEYRAEEFRDAVRGQLRPRRAARPLPRPQAAAARARDRARLGRPAPAARHHQAASTSGSRRRSPSATSRCGRSRSTARSTSSRCCDEPARGATGRARDRPPLAHALRRGLRHLAVRRGMAVGGARERLPAAAATC